MAVPKKKMSKTRSGKRFNTWVKKEGVRISNAIKLVVCKSCGAKIKAHNICPECGYYKDKPVLKVKSKVVSAKKVTAAKV